MVFAAKSPARESCPVVNSKVIELTRSIKVAMKSQRWQIMLRRRGHPASHYVHTLKTLQTPTSGEQIEIRDIDGVSVTGIVRSFHRVHDKSRLPIYTVEVDEVDGLNE